MRIIDIAEYVAVRSCRLCPPFSGQAEYALILYFKKVLGQQYNTKFLALL